MVSSVQGSWRSRLGYMLSEYRRKQERTGPKRSRKIHAFRDAAKDRGIVDKRIQNKRLRMLEPDVRRKDPADLVRYSTE